MILVHGGAGVIVPERHERLKAGCRAAAAAGKAVLDRGGSALDAVVAAVRVLEDDPEFDAGTGSSLTREGTVETCATVMDGKRRRAGAVAAVPDLGAPVIVARAMLETGEHVLVPDTELDPRVNPELLQKGIRSLIGVRLGLGRERFGVLYVESLQPRQFTESELAAAESRRDLAISWQALGKDKERKRLLILSVEDAVARVEALRVAVEDHPVTHARRRVQAADRQWLEARGEVADLESVVRDMEIASRRK